MIRSIEYAHISEVDKIISISEITNSQIERFELRKKVQLNEDAYFCIECGQKLNVVASKNDIVHFKHMPRSEECILKNSNPDDIKLFNEYWASKESPRHIELKNLIGERLKNTQGVSSVSIDDKFIIRGNQKRKPDVYCKYGEVEIVFEIQLSDLSLNYLVNRHEFYQRNGIYLIWILDNFNVNKRTQLVRDIKYLNQYQNFFKLDESIDSFRLVCKYKESWINTSFEVEHVWKERFVILNEMTFNNEDHQVFYINFLENFNQLKEEAIVRKNNNLSQSIERRILKEKADAQIVANEIIEEIKANLNSNKVQFDDLLCRIRKLNVLEVDEFNSKLAFNEKPVICSYIKKSQNSNFILFLLQCEEIIFDVNLLSQNKTAFEYLLENQNLKFKKLLFKELLKRGYVLTEKDLTYHNIDDWANTILLGQKAMLVGSKDLIDQIFESKNQKIILKIESLKTREIIGDKFKKDNWIAFGNNIAQFYNDYWVYFEKAFKYYGIWSQLITAESFEHKVSQLKVDLPIQKTEFKELFNVLYPEIK